MRSRVAVVACAVVASIMTNASALLAVAVSGAPEGAPYELQRTASSAARDAVPIFTFESDEFWLNLHKFLYVLGRAQNKSADASREAVAGAPAESTRGQESLSESERRIWADAIATYARGLSRQDPISNRDL